MIDNTLLMIGDTPLMVRDTPLMIGDIPFMIGDTPLIVSATPSGFWISTLNNFVRYKAYQVKNSDQVKNFKRSDKNGKQTSIKMFRVSYLCFTELHFLQINKQTNNKSVKLNFCFS